jgi:hypothetical protein
MSQRLPKLGPEREYGPEFGMRAGTKVATWPINFIFNQGGMGDFLNFSVATRWLGRNSPWVEGRLFVPRYLAPIMRELHAEFVNWTVFESEDVKRHIEFGTSYLGHILLDGQPMHRQFLTPTGAHLIDVGFAWYVGMTPAPPGELLPVLDYPSKKLPFDLKGKRYAVIPTGFSAEARRVQGRHVNPIIDHLNARGVLPVFLGKRDLLGDGHTISKFSEDIAYDKGLDLRNQTDVRQAALIMQHAAFTVGLDCGLLHLAALMKDSKIIFGYNITTIEHREPRRNHGKTINIAIGEVELACAPCQSKWKNIPVHKFTGCYYGDSKCVDLLFKGNAVRWRNAIDQMLEA